MANTAVEGDSGLALGGAGLDNEAALLGALGAEALEALAPGQRAKRQQRRKQNDKQLREQRAWCIHRKSPNRIGIRDGRLTKEQCLPAPRAPRNLDWAAPDGAPRLPATVAPRASQPQLPS